MAENEPGQDPGLPEDARLTSLDRRLKQAQLDEVQRTGGRQPNVAKWTRSPEWRILSVMIGYPVGSALIGVAIDYFAGTKGAWVVVVMGFVGFAVAIWEIWKISKQASK